MSRLEKAEAGTGAPTLWLSIELSVSSNVLDLSEQVPFYVNIDYWRRGSFDRELQQTPVDVVTFGTIFDISSALSEGLLTLEEGQDPDSEQAEQDRNLPRDVFKEAGDASETRPQSLVRLKPGRQANIWSPGRIRCTLSPTVISALKHGATYVLRFPPEARRKLDPWTGGITWWKRCPNTQGDLSTFSAEHAADVWMERSSTFFRALRDPSRPPQIDYEIGFSPSTISLGDANAMSLTVKFHLHGQRSHTVMWRRHSQSHGPDANALGFSNVGNFNFDLFDLVTGELLSAKPMYGNMSWSDKLSPDRPIIKDQLREMLPGQSYTAYSVLSNHITNEMKTFERYFRLDNANSCIGKRLAVKLRPISTYWSTKTIAELFEKDEAVKQDKWFIPLEIASERYAEFTLVE